MAPRLPRLGNCQGGIRDILSAIKGPGFTAPFAKRPIVDRPRLAARPSFDSETAQAPNFAIAS
jgi:hypothetical protein